ncbi:MAG: hypothetical protein ACLR0P_03480 [Oscillospiraceae bacterium]
MAAALTLTVMLAGCSSQEEAEPLPAGHGHRRPSLTAGEAVLDQLLEGDYEAVYGVTSGRISGQSLTAQSDPGPGGAGVQEAGDYQELKSPGSLAAPRGRSTASPSSCASSPRRRCLHPGGL